MLRAMHSRWGYERMVGFIIGFFIGAFTGIIIIAVLNASRDDF